MTPSMRTFTRYLLLVPAVALMAACQDGPVDAAPVADEIVMPDPQIFVDYAPDRLSADITVTQTGGWFVLGRHAIYFPKRSICEAGSSYGPTEWDMPCRPANGSMQFHVEVDHDETGRTWLDFTPAVRFVPSKQKSGWVLLFMWTHADPMQLATAGPSILWSPAIGVPGIDESLTDATLKTSYIPGTSISYRRIKHFSGYNVGIGVMECDPATQECEEEGGEGGEGGEGEGTYNP